MTQAPFTDFDVFNHPELAYQNVWNEPNPSWVKRWVRRYLKYTYGEITKEMYDSGFASKTTELLLSEVLPKNFPNVFDRTQHSKDVEAAVRGWSYAFCKDFTFPITTEF
jgi:hypothetical protein